MPWKDIAKEVGAYAFKGAAIAATGFCFSGGAYLNRKVQEAVESWNSKKEEPKTPSATPASAPSAPTT